MIELSVKGDIERALAKFRHLNQNEVATVVVRSLNRVIASARTQAVREIKKRYNINPKFLKDKIGEKDNRYNALKIWRANKSTLTANLKAYGKPIPLIAFPVKQTDKGVQVSVYKGRSKLLPGVFIATTASGHTSTFGRGKYSKGQFQFRSKRLTKYPKNDLPIGQIMTTSVKSAIVTPGILQALKINVEANLPKRLEHEIAYLLK